MEIKPEDIWLKQTCGACPEQYDALYDGKTVGYLRLRHGYFSVSCPGTSGEIVYDSEPNGDGVFDADEREEHLQKAKEAVAQWMNNRPSPR